MTVRCSLSTTSLSPCLSLSLSVCMCMCLPAALRRQTNPNWAAFFFLVHQRPLVFELQQLLASFEDSRLFYVPLSAEQRPAVSTPCP